MLGREGLATQRVQEVVAEPVSHALGKLTAARWGSLAARLCVNVDVKTRPSSNGVLRTSQPRESACAYDDRPLSQLERPNVLLHNAPCTCMQDNGTGVHANAVRTSGSNKLVYQVNKRRLFLCEKHLVFECPASAMQSVQESKTCFVQCLG